MSDKLEYHLEKIQEEELQEFVDPILGGAAIATVLIIKELVLFFIYVAQMASSMKVESKMTKDLNEVLKKMGVRKDFTVHIVVSQIPNAFTPGGKHVYITTGLKKIMNERESMAILLHEVYHAIDWHIWKRMAAEFPLYYIAVPIAVAAAIATGPLAIITALVVFSITMAILKIPINRIQGRKQELAADNYAVKAGYGQDLASSFEKLLKMLEKMQAGSSCGKMCRIINRIEAAMDEHPPLKQRIEAALKDAELMKDMAKAKVTAIVYKVKKLFGKGE